MYIQQLKGPTLTIKIFVCLLTPTLVQGRLYRKTKATQRRCTLEQTDKYFESEKSLHWSMLAVVL